MNLSATALALQLPRGTGQAMRLGSMGQLSESGPDPDSVERLLLKVLGEEVMTNQMAGTS
jgi:hypothetical protein